MLDKNFTELQKLYESKPREIFSNNLNKYMILSGETRNSLAEKTGFNYNTITKWLKAISYPPPEKIQVLANHFGIHHSQLTNIKDHYEVEGNEDSFYPRTVTYKNKQALIKIIAELTDESLDTLLKTAELLPKKEK